MLLQLSEWSTLPDAMDNLFFLISHMDTYPLPCIAFHSTYMQCHVILLLPLPTFLLFNNNEVPLAI